MGRTGCCRGWGTCKAFSVDILLRMHFIEQGSAQWASVGHMSEQMNEQAIISVTLNISRSYANTWALDLSNDREGGMA